MEPPAEPGHPEDIERLRPGLQIMALRALGDREAANEAAQETLVRASEALREGRLHDREKLGAFVRGIARHVIADAKSARTRHDMIRVVRSSGLSAGDMDPLNSLIREEERLRLRKALADLYPRDRDILHLSFFEGLSCTEIAESLGEPASRIRKRKSRALRRLRTALLGVDNPTGDSMFARSEERE